jgi:hypothetical protein
MSTCRFCTIWTSGVDSEQRSSILMCGKALRNTARIRRSEHDVALNVRRKHPRQKLIVKTQDRAGVSGDGLAVGRERHAPSFMREKRLADQFLKALKLKRDGRLRASEPPRGFGQASALDHRKQRTKNPNVETDQIHAAAAGLDSCCGI